MVEQANAILETYCGDPVHFEGMCLTGDLRGLLFEAKVEQRFRNRSNEHMEVVYRFPLPWGAVLLGVDVTLGDQRLMGEVVEKQAAEAGYEEAIADGYAAVMLERHADGTHSMNLGNLSPGEGCVISLHYAQTLHFVQQSLRLKVPTLIAPRYGNPADDRGAGPHYALTHSAEAYYAFDITLRLHGALAQARVGSPSHPLRMAMADGVLVLSLARASAMDRDFVLVMDGVGHEGVAVAERHAEDTEAVTVLASFHPRCADTGGTPVSVKFLVDCSGSMQGGRIAAARRAMTELVNQLNTGDRFSLSRFGSDVAHRSRGLWKATDATREAARRWAGALQADLGGTRMPEALNSTFALAHGGSCDVLMITDGDVYAIEDTVDTARESGHRLFVVAVGSSPTGALVHGLVESTGGACEFVAPGEPIEPAMLRMFRRLRSVRFDGVHVTWPEGVPPRWTSPLPRAVFSGDTVAVYAVFDHAPLGEAVLGANTPDASASQSLGVATLARPKAMGGALVRMGAAQRLKADPGSFGPADGAIAAFAVTHRLVTEHTNYLLVHERADARRGSDMPKFQVVQQPLPDDLVSFSKADPMAVPSVWRRPRLRSVIDASMDDFEVPAFLLSSAIEPMAPQQSAAVRHWAQVDQSGSAKPLDACQWLLATPRASWPQTYAELIQAGLGAWVVDWLELVVAESVMGGAAEAEVVKAFLLVLAHPATSQVLHGPLGVPFDGQARGHLLRAAMVKKASPDDAPTALQAFVAASLRGMLSTRWPDAVFDLSEDRICEAPADHMYS